MLSRYIFLAVMIALFVLYIIICREKSAVFYLGVAWFITDISAKIVGIYFMLNIETLAFDSINNISIFIALLRNISAALLFLITICYYISRKRKQKQT